MKNAYHKHLVPTGLFKDKTSMCHASGKSLKLAYSVNSGLSDQMAHVSVVFVIRFLFIEKDPKAKHFPAGSDLIGDHTLILMTRVSVNPDANSPFTCDPGGLGRFTADPCYIVYVL